MLKKLKSRIITYFFLLKEYYYKHKFQNVVFGEKIIFYGAPMITSFSNKSIYIGDNVVLCSKPKDTALGVNHPVILRTLNNEAVIKIGKDTGISGATICAAKKITIGKSCLIGANVTIMDTDFHPIQSLNRRHSQENIGVSEVIIEDNVFIGYNAIILKGVHIGKSSVIGAGSVVINDIPENVIAGGNPAKILKRI